MGVLLSELSQRSVASTACRGLETHDSTTSLVLEQEVDPTALVHVDVPNPREILKEKLLPGDATVLDLEANEIGRL